MNAYLAGVAILLISSILYLLLRKKAEPDGWSAGPLINGTNYSVGVNVAADGSYTFPTSAVDPLKGIGGVHYVTKACNGIKGSQVRLRYRIEGDPDIKFVSAKAGVDGTHSEIIAGPVIYFQRRGDDWAGYPTKTETYRWWATFNIPALVADGQEHEIVVPLSGRWTAEEVSNSIDQPKAFEDALLNAARIGYTWPGMDGYGHGLYATGYAKFVLICFTIT